MTTNTPAPKKKAERRALTLFTIVTLIAAPASLSTAWHYANGVSGGRPLAVTHEFEALNSTGSVRAIVAIVEWGRDGNRSFTQQEFHERLNQAFYHHGEEVVVVFDVIPGQSTRVTYQVGSNKFGPYSPSRAARGVRGAIEAFRLHGN